MAFTVYGTNLLDEATFGGDTQLPNSPAFGGGTPPGSRPPPTFSPLNKGRVIGAEMRLKF
jgi:iron complex outermembrane receptor protein